MSAGVGAQTIGVEEAMQAVLMDVAIRGDWERMKSLLDEFKAQGYDWRPALGKQLEWLWAYRGEADVLARQLDKKTIGGHSIIDEERITLKNQTLAYLESLNVIAPSEIETIREIIAKEAVYRERQEEGLPSSIEITGALSQEITRAHSQGSDGLIPLGIAASQVSCPSSVLPSLSPPVFNGVGSPVGGRTKFPSHSHSDSSTHVVVSGADVVDGTSAVGGAGMVVDTNLAGRRRPRPKNALDIGDLPPATLPQQENKRARRGSIGLAFYQQGPSEEDASIGKEFDNQLGKGAPIKDSDSQSGFNV